MSLLLLCAVIAGAADFTLIDISAPVPSEALYPGELTGPPVMHWVVDLPGASVNAASHAERSRPVVVGEYVLLGSAGSDALHMVSRSNGGLVRSFKADAPVASEAVVDAGRVYFADTGGTVWCYQLDGTLVWRHAGEAPILARPLVVDGLVIVTNVDDLTEALKYEDADLAWRYKRKRDMSRVSELSLYAAPGAVHFHEDVLLGYSDGAIVSVNIKTGDPSWDLQVGAGRYPDLVAEPITRGEQVFVSGYMEPFVAVDPATSKVLWRVAAGASSQPVITDVVVDGKVEPLLLHPGTDGTLRAVRPATGDIVYSWTAETPSALTSPVVTPAGIIVASAGGSFEIIDPTTWSTVWSWPGEQLLVGVSTAPVVAGRQVLVVSNHGRLYSLLAPTQVDSPERDFTLFDPPIDGR
jgi:outer membrane protein assembly factor BamB